MCIISCICLLFCREALPNGGNAKVIIDIQHPDLVSTNPPNFTITPNVKEWIIYVEGLNVGHSVVTANITPNNITE